MCGGRRDFASVQRLQAQRYDVTVDLELAARARQLLNDLDRASTAPVRVVTARPVPADKDRCAHCCRWRSSSACFSPDASAELEGLRGEPRFQSGAMIGVNGRIGSVLLRKVCVEEPPGQVFRQGSQARIYLQLFNQGEAPNELVAVTTPAAGSVDLRRDRNRDGRFEPVASLPLPTGPLGQIG